ncbi:hypothetical protein Ddc_21709 [Ditylenchus destructor]|nr:hypothetical protein Ddc_21709 [Ditylenchus destructor]
MDWMTGLCRLVGSGESTDKEREGRCAALGQVRKEEMGKGHLGKDAEAHAFHSGAKFKSFTLNHSIHVLFETIGAIHVRCFLLFESKPIGTILDCLPSAQESYRTILFIQSRTAFLIDWVFVEDYIETFFLRILLNYFCSNQAMSNSKLVAPFVFDSLYYLNRDQLERFSIVCRPLKNFIDRYFHSKPNRVFVRLCIREGTYALEHDGVYWHPNRVDYSVQQFLAGQKCSIEELINYWSNNAYYSFPEMRPYLAQAIRIKRTIIYVAGDSTYNPEHIAEMESIAYLWRDGNINIWNARNDDSQIVAENFQPILNSPTILQCRLLEMESAVLSFKDYKILYTVSFIEMGYANNVIDPDSWPQFLEQPGVKPIVVLRELHQENIDNLLDRLSKAFSSAVLPNAFKIAFMHDNKPLTEFRESNKTSGEILELKKGLPTEYPNAWKSYNHKYTLERSSV